MFTVILLSESAKKIFNGSRDYFKPFEENGSIAFCDWVQSPEAKTLYEVVPDLTEKIRGKAQWRAIIVDHARGMTKEQGRDKENPFDFVDNRETRLSLEPSKHRMVRLAHVLLGYPHLPAKDFEAHLVYKDEDGYEVQAEVGEVGSLPEQSGLSRRFTEVEHSEEDKHKHQELVDFYRMKEVHPSEAIFIVTRDSVEADEQAALLRAWQLDGDVSSSRFVERNDYPPKSRFATYELLEEENSGYEQDLQTLWLGVLTLATNELPTSAFQADRLYRLALEVSKPGLGYMLNDHISTLVAVRDTLSHRIRGIRKTYSMDVTDLLAPIEVAVAFDDVGGSDLEVSTGKIGLATDHPRSESSWWKEKESEVAANADRFLRKPRRALARSVQDARLQARMPDETVRILDEIEIDELSEHLDSRLHELLLPATANILDERRFRSVIAEKAKEVRAYIRERASLSAILSVMGVVFGIWIVVLSPYLFLTQRNGTEPLASAGLNVVLVLVLLLVVLLVTLVVMRERLRRLVEEMNAATLKQVGTVRSGVSTFAKFLSEVATYSRGRALLRGSEKALEREREQVRSFEILRAHIVEKIAEEKLVVQSSGTPLAIKPDRAYLTHFDPSNKRDVDNLFRYPVTPHAIPFGLTGEYIEAPYDFIDMLSLDHISVFEPASQESEDVLNRGTEVTGGSDSLGRSGERETS